MLTRLGCTVNVLLTVHGVLEFPGRRITSARVTDGFVLVGRGGLDRFGQGNRVPELGGAKTGKHGRRIARVNGTLGVPLTSC